MTPYCPDCGQLLSGYDTRARKAIDCAGVAHWYSLRRLKCLDCNKLHLELPDFMMAHKHYNAQTIKDIIENNSESCPADNSTIWRWRQESREENHPPTLQCFSNNIMIDSLQSNYKGESI